MTQPHQPILRQDYRPPAYLVDTVELHVALHPTATRIRATLAMRRNPAAAVTADLELDGEALTLVSATLDGAALEAARIRHLPSGGLRIAGVPESFLLETVVETSPAANSELSGLYLSGGNFFTQCEAEGFRRITYFPDRPDVMARFGITIEGDRATCPVLLSNGNPAGSGELPGGRHWARWEDPHPKPSYLFALVAGDLVCVPDSFTTKSGRPVTLGIYVRRGDEESCGHAMAALKASMTWDEEVYGLEYDLDVFNIAAVSDFNMGAMENKGLNVFNTKYILARPETATDADYEGIETVVAHEYFHNWTGNRVTCRDWFQLSLKEGLTVFRDQQFSADQGSAAVKRLSDVRRLRAAQFPEDAGPLAHPVRPDSYVEINNFYTATVYQKGAEVVRMMRRLIGPANFRKGMDLYFERHDNQAVTIEDFVAAMQDASGIDLARFSRWYAQAGTPELSVREAHDPGTGRYTLTLRQSVPATPGQPEKLPVPIPVAMGLLDPQGQPLPLRLSGEAEGPMERVLLLEEAEQDFVFEGLPTCPVPSLLRGFSAPVKLSGLSLEQLGFLAARDRDAFVRWESTQQYATAEMLRLVGEVRAQRPIALPEGLATIVAALLDAAAEDPAFAAEALSLPSEDFVADQMPVADPDAVHEVRHFLRRALGSRFAPRFAALYRDMGETGPLRIDGPAIGRRALRNTSLTYLSLAEGAPGAEGLALAEAQFGAAGSMTDVLAALRVLTESDSSARETALAAFHAMWQRDELVLDKWFALQAVSARADALQQVQALYQHPDFDLRNPNRVRALVGSFAAGNPVRFHDASGAGYRFLADAVIALDRVNTQVAARMVSPLGAWKRQDAARGALMRVELQRILAQPDLSKGTYEKVSKGLAA